MTLRKETHILKRSITSLSLVLISLSFYSCQEVTKAKSSSARINSDINYGKASYALVYEENPIIAQDSTTLSNPDWASIITSQLITTNTYLDATCGFEQYGYSGTDNTTTTNCIEIKNDNSASTSKLQSQSGGSWMYETGSDEFYQVNTFYHINKITDRFLESLSFTHKQTHALSSMYLPPSTKYNLASTKSFWLSENESNKTLKAYSKCFITPMNSYFDPATSELCMGWNEEISNFRMAQDPSVIYHEMGHVFVKIMMNQRNTRYSPLLGGDYKEEALFKSELGTQFYEEAGAINEGIADYFAYYMTNRNRLGEWAMGRFYGASRPVSEDDSEHAANISTQSGERLSYPQYLHYDSNNKEKNIEDIHIAGQIVSHYLVALSQSLKTKCSYTSDIDTTSLKHNKANDYILMLLNETLAEIGDLTASGSDILDYFASYNVAHRYVYFTNLNPQNSFLWTHQVNPPNFRRFFRIFGKNIKNYVSDSFYGVCPEFTLDNSEQLLDEYGLLLFEDYKDAGDGIQVTETTYSDSSGLRTFKKTEFVSEKTYSDMPNNYLLSSNAFTPKTTHTKINQANRKNTIMVSKDFLEINQDGPIAYVFDGQTYISEILSYLTFEGKNVNTSTGLAGVEYNNGNVKISPGEIVGVAVNLRNNSNSPMAGIQILANDWDHMKLVDKTKNYVNRMENQSSYSTNLAVWKPCQIDGHPKLTEGGVTESAEPYAQGDCEYFSRTNSQIVVDSTDSNSDSVLESTNPRYDIDSPQPICNVQLNSTNETQWVSQDYYRKTQLDLEDTDCLNNQVSQENFNPNECLIRVLPGANQATFGKIDPSKTWGETISGTSGEAPVFHSGTALLLEVNKWIQPGTTFNCRMRVRFSNCIDCYNDETNEPYKDYEFTGHKPFKVLNFSFTVID